MPTKYPVELGFVGSLLHMGQLAASYGNIPANHQKELTNSVLDHLERFQGQLVAYHPKRSGLVSR